MATSNAFLFAFIFFVKKKQAIFFSFRQVWCIHETKVAMYFFDFVLSNNFVNVKQTLWSKMSKMKYNVGRWFKHVRPNKRVFTRVFGWVRGNIYYFETLAYFTEQTKLPWKSYLYLYFGWCRSQDSSRILNSSYYERFWTAKFLHAMQLPSPMRDKEVCRAI